jgi:hypothetical protein
MQRAESLMRVSISSVDIHPGERLTGLPLYKGTGPAESDTANRNRCQSVGWRPEIIEQSSSQSQAMRLAN